MRSDVYRAIILATALAGSIFLTAHVSYNPPPPKTFSFLQTVPAHGTSITVSDVTGNIFATRWSQPQVLINGSIAVTGEGATPDSVQIQEQYNPYGSLSFQPFYSDKTPGRGYSVNVNLYIPSKTNFTSISLQAVGGGMIQLDALNASRTSVETSAGNITMALYPAPSGYYSIATHSGGRINLKVPETSSFTLHATSGEDGNVTVHGFDKCQIELNPIDYVSGNTRTTRTSTATITCGDHSAIVEVTTDPSWAGDIMISSV